MGNCFSCWFGIAVGEGASNGSSIAPSRNDEESRLEKLSNEKILPTSPPSLRIFTFSELKAATKSFRADMMLGEGGFGEVFKGWLDGKGTGKSGSGTVIAVKKLNSQGFQGLKEWQSEVNFLGTLSHPNLVKLLGYCSENKELLLVYEFMQKGSLENHLFRKGSFQPLTWDIRFKIILGAAHGLAFLHNAEKNVIYRDFKASNILLDGLYMPKISDFGLAKLGPSLSRSHVSTQIMGTFGYAAPEYVNTGHLYVKSDVYGFGVVLVEILTGQRALDTNRPNGKHALVEWIKPYLKSKKKLKGIMDYRLEGKYPSNIALEIATLALKCLESQPKNRPSMNEVLQVLEELEKLSSSSSCNRPADGREQSNQAQVHRHPPLHPSNRSAHRMNLGVNQQHSL